MAPPILLRKFPILFIIGLLIGSSSSSSTMKNKNNDYLESECLNVARSQFVGSLESAISGVRQVTSVVSKFGNVFGDFRLSNAISDCLDLLDFTSEDLSWTVSASQNPTGKHNSTGDLSSDLRTWISASLTNQATCIEGFDGTNGVVKTVVQQSMTQITSLITELLTMVNPPAAPKKLDDDDGFPPWVPHKDRRLIQQQIINGVPADVIVAQDGTGNFTNITAAVLSAPNYNTTRYVIYIKKGVYNEYVEIKKKKWNIMMVGEGIGVTVITGNHNNVDGWTTFRSATFAVSARGFIARDITFENTAGPEKHQAVALRSDSDLSVFFRCEMKGYQDTLYTHTMRQFFRECKISGTVDFIFGDGTVVFQNCLIQARKGLSNQKNTITAQGRKDPNQPTGFSIQFCNITAETGLLQDNSTQTYLGRPWKLYSRTIFMQNYFSNIINPAGWLEMNGSQGLDTLYYGEYMNTGPGAGTGGRVTWPGYHLLNTSAQANNFTVSQFIEGNLWLPSTGVKYTAGLGT